MSRSDTYDENSRKHILDGMSHAEGRSVEYSLRSGGVADPTRPAEKIARFLARHGVEPKEAADVAHAIITLSEKTPDATADQHRKMVDTFVRPLVRGAQSRENADAIVSAITNFSAIHTADKTRFDIQPMADAAPPKPPQR